MKNFIFFVIILTVLIIIGGVVLTTARNSGEPAPLNKTALNNPTNYEYFWSETCPHCAKVNDFMESWDGKDKISLTKYEINESVENQNYFLQRGEFCDIPRNQMGVPLLVTPDGQCLPGDEPIIEYLDSLNL
jgi:glutaredoxin-related protein